MRQARYEPESYKLFVKNSKPAQSHDRGKNESFPADYLTTARRIRQGSQTSASAFVQAVHTHGNTATLQNVHAADVPSSESTTVRMPSRQLNVDWKNIFDSETDFPLDVYIVTFRAAIKKDIDIDLLNKILFKLRQLIHRRFSEIVSSGKFDDIKEIISKAEAKVRRHAHRDLKTLNFVLKNAGSDTQVLIQVREQAEVWWQLLAQEHMRSTTFGHRKEFRLLINLAELGLGGRAEQIHFSSQVQSVF